MFLHYFRIKAECHIKNNLARIAEDKEAKSLSKQHLKAGKKHIQVSTKFRAFGYFPQFLQKVGASFFLGFEKVVFLDKDTNISKCKDSSVFLA